MKDAAAAFKRISETKSTFISRGDNSGTHIKEKSLWAAASIKPGGAWYLEIGQGMAECLLMAHEKQAYTLTDLGTYYALKSKLSLEILVKSDERLKNIYSIIATNPKKHSRNRGINHKGATALIEWVTSPKCQRLIGNYKKNGHVLFHPIVHNKS
jgi:tungstate transport system substrate-binding protein